MTGQALTLDLRLGMLGPHPFFMTGKADVLLLKGKFSSQGDGAGWSIR